MEDNKTAGTISIVIGENAPIDVPATQSAIDSLNFIMERQENAERDMHSWVSAAMAHAAKDLGIGVVCTTKLEALKTLRHDREIVAATGKVRDLDMEELDAMFYPGTAFLRDDSVPFEPGIAGIVEAEWFPAPVRQGRTFLLMPNEISTEPSEWWHAGDLAGRTGLEGQVIASMAFEMDSTAVIHQPTGAIFIEGQDGFEEAYSLASGNVSFVFDGLLTEIDLVTMEPTEAEMILNSRDDHGMYEPRFLQGDGCDALVIYRTEDGRTHRTTDGHTIAILGGNARGWRLDGDGVPVPVVGEEEAGMFAQGIAICAGSSLFVFGIMVAVGLAATGSDAWPVWVGMAVIGLIIGAWGAVSVLRALDGGDK